MSDMTTAPEQCAKPSSFIEIMDLWPTTAKFAEAVDHPYQRVYKWRENGRINVAHWPRVIAAVARDHTITLSVEDLYVMALASPDGSTKPARAEDDVARRNQTGISTDDDRSAA